jgi:hypothetical protein
MPSANRKTVIPVVNANNVEFAWLVAVSELKKLSMVSMAYKSIRISLRIQNTATTIMTTAKMSIFCPVGFSSSGGR